MKKCLFYLIFLCIGLPVFSQQVIEVVDFKQNLSDISARTNRRDDVNGIPCALIKVQFPLAGVLFYGNITGSVSYKTNEYWVYMPQPSNTLEIRLQNYIPLVVNFDNFEIGAVESNCTYELCLLAKEKDAPELYEDGMIALAKNDVVFGFESLTKAADAGYTPAWYALGNESIVPFDLGYDVDPNEPDAYKIAIDYYKKAAEKGLPEAQYALGKMLLEYKEMKSNGENHNITKITIDKNLLDNKYIWDLIEKAANAGNTDAQWLMISNKSWCDNAANKGVAIAEYGMGMWYDVTKRLNSLDYFQNWYEILSKANEAILNSEERAIDINIAFSWYEKAAKDGLNIAKWTLADKYQEGNCTQKDIAKAVELRIEAAEDGDISLQDYLAHMFCFGVMSAFYDDGGWGDYSVRIEENMEEAGRWMKRVLNHSDKDLIWLSRNGGSTVYKTLNELAYRYSESGNVKESIYWYQRAAEWGSENAIEKLKEMGLNIPQELFK